MRVTEIRTEEMGRDDHRVYIEGEDEDGEQITLEIVVCAEGVITNQLQDDEITKSAWATWTHVLEGLT